MSATVTTDPVREILERLEGVKATGPGQWMARCPAHEDRHASLSVTTGDDGRALLRCHTGCTTQSIVSKIGITMANLFPPKMNGNGKHRAADDPVVAQYDYRDADNRVVARKCRKRSKAFFWQHPNGRGGWAGGRNGAVHLYNLPALLNAREESDDRWVLLVEGEKDVDRATTLGFTATTSPDGASKDLQRPKWRDEFNEQLAGLRVCVICDNDGAGLSHGTNAANQLLDRAREVRLIRAMPGVADHGDLSDWCDAGGTTDELSRLVASAPAWSRSHEKVEGESPESFGPVLTPMSQVKGKPISWLWKKHIALGKLNLVFGDPGLGKSFVTIDWAARVSTGSPWPDGTIPERGSVIIISAEDDIEDTIKPRLDQAGADASKVFVLEAVRAKGDGGRTIERSVTLADIGHIADALDQVPDCKLLIIDPVSAYLGGSDGHRNDEIRALLAPISKLAADRGVAVVMVTHMSKGGAGGGRALYRAMGSLAFAAAARSAWIVVRDEANPNRRLFLPAKNNIGDDTTGFAYSIVNGAICWEKSPIIQTADQALAANSSEPGRRGPEPEALEAAKEWLTELLENGPVGAKKVEEEAEAAGVTMASVRRAKTKMGVRSFRQGWDGAWMWKLPGSTATLPSDGVGEELPPGF